MEIGTAPNTTTVGEQLDLIAAAYGYEGHPAGCAGDFFVILVDNAGHITLAGSLGRIGHVTQRASGANATTGTGGVNARQIGLGVKASSININIAGQGASQSTGNPLDIMITGENFFVVNDGTQNYFTRDGSFYIDGAGSDVVTDNIHLGLV